MGGIGIAAAAPAHRKDWTRANAPCAAGDVPGGMAGDC
jgi:hypothetical protein